MKKYFLILTMMLCTALGAMAQNTLEITGTVTDTSGEPLVGATVTVKDVPGLGSVTDIDGNYKIKAKEYQILIVTYVGFAPQQITIKQGQTKIDVVMEEEKSNAIDEVVVTAMGAQKKLTVTGAVTNVEMGDLKHYSSSNLTNTLAGNVPGIMAYQSSGQPGKNTSEFWIRGI